jgi:hypothetical protein
MPDILRYTIHKCAGMPYVLGYTRNAPYFKMNKNATCFKVPMECHISKNAQE